MTNCRCNGEPMQRLLKRLAFGFAPDMTTGSEHVPASHHSVSDRLRPDMSWVALGVLLGSSLAVRIGWLVFKTTVIEQEGSYYARLSENLAVGNGWVGIHAYGLQLGYPPLFPLLIAGSYLLVHNAELAGRLVSLLFGSFLFLPIFLIAREMYDQRVAYIAAVFGVFHPILVGMSVAVYSEATYLFLLFMGVFYGVCSARKLSYWKATAAGTLLGLAYLRERQRSKCLCVRQSALAR